MIKGFVVTDFGEENSSPAAINRKTGIVLINLPVWKQIPKPIQKIILLHEEGHYVLNSSSEHEADAYAFKKFANTEPYSLKNLVKAISETLSFRIPEHAERLKRQLLRAVFADFYYNGNKEILPFFLQLTNTKSEMNEKQFTIEGFSKFLKANGFGSIEEVNQLPESERERILAQFMLLPDTQRYLFETGVQRAGDVSHYDGLNLFAGDDFSNYDGDWEDWKGFKKIGSWIKEKALPAVSKLTTAVSNVAANVVAPLANTIGIKIDAEKLAKTINAINPINIANKMINKNPQLAEKMGISASDLQQIPQNTQQPSGNFGGGFVGANTGTPQQPTTENNGTEANHDKKPVTESTPPANNDKKESFFEKNKTLLIVGAVVVVGLIIWFVKKK